MKSLFMSALLIMLIISACSEQTDEKSDSVSQVNSEPDTAQSITDHPCGILSRAEIDSIKQAVQDMTVDQVQKDEFAVLETSMGDIVVKFFPEIAPKHCRSFKRLAVSGFLNCTYFHRIIKGFVIQGGDILTRDDSPNNDGTGGPGYTVPAEFNDTSHDLGILSMARSSDPNSAGSQFFICLSREKTKALDGNYTVFGRVVKGLDVVQKIGNVAVEANPMTGEPSFPVEHVYLYRVYMINDGSL